MRRLLLLSARILVSLVLLYLALRGINFTAIQSRLSQINIGWIALAVLITIAAVMVQCRRMINEEAILKVTFPEYRAYAANTSFLLPTKLGQFFTGSNPP